MFQNVCNRISPQLIYVNLDTVDKRDYIDAFLEKEGISALLLSVLEVQSIHKRKNLPLTDNSYYKMHLLNRIMYKNFSVKKVLIVDFPHLLPELIHFESLNTKFSYFVDLLNINNIDFSKDYNIQMYFLENQKRIRPELSRPLG
jgi:hypothetical protein